MKLRFHSDLSVFYNQSGDLYPEPKETVEELEAKLKEACEKLKSLPTPKPAIENTDDDDDMLKSQMNNFVQTDPLIGITRKDYRKIKHILNL